MSLYRCAACGSPNVVTDSQAGATKFNYLKGAAGTVILGAGGAVAGIESSTKTVYKCPDCGLALDRPMDFNMKNLIDIGLMSVDARKNLTYHGIKVEWEFIKRKFKNIEEGLADEFLAAAKATRDQIMAATATATKEEFDSAIDVLRDYTHYKSHSIAKEEYILAKKSLFIVVENLSKYLPPETFDKLVKYRGYSTFLCSIFASYLTLKYFEEYGIALMYTAETLNEYLATNPFMKAFADTYINQLSGWDYDNDGKTIRYVGTPRWYHDFFCVQYRSPNENALNAHYLGPILFPRFIIQEELLGYWDSSFEDSPITQKYEKIHAEDPDRDTYIIDDVIENYFSYFPNEKARYEELINNRKIVISHKDILDKQNQLYKELRAKLNAASEELDISNVAMDMLNSKIEKLSKRIFGKSKIKKLTEIKASGNTKIEKLKNQILSIKEQMRTCEEAREIANNKLQKLESDKEFINEMLYQFNSFIAWHIVTE